MDERRGRRKERERKGGGGGGGARSSPVCQSPEKKRAPFVVAVVAPSTEFPSSLSPPPIGALPPSTPAPQAQGAAQRPRMKERAFVPPFPPPNISVGGGLPSPSSAPSSPALSLTGCRREKLPSSGPPSPLPSPSPLPAPGSYSKIGPKRVFQGRGQDLGLFGRSLGREGGGLACPG